ncbi:MAG: galactokinase [Pseudonocardia sp.]
MSVRDEFVRHVGSGPAGAWAAPGRVNLIGEHTDYNDGFALPMALDRRVLVAAAPAVGGGSRVWSGQQGGAAVGFLAARVVPGDVPGWAGYAAGVFWALRAGGHPVLDLDVVLSGDLPMGAGLASSAALGCAVALALTDLAGVRLARTELASVVRRSENDFVGAPTGGMDQLAVVHGRRGHLVYIDTRSLAVDHVPFDPAAQGLALLVVDTRAPHAHVDGQYGERRRRCADAARMLGVAALRDVDVPGLGAALARLPDGPLRSRARHVVTENDRVREMVALLRSGADLRAAGVLLTASHASLRDDFEVTVPHLDVAVAAALGAGAHGARMTGGGFGGCVIALVDAGTVPAVVTAIERAFAGQGFGRPAAFTATPSPGARRLTRA